jgi:hypothetical protein
MALPRTLSDASRRVDGQRRNVGARRGASTGMAPLGRVPPEGHMDHPQWVAVGLRLGEISRSNQWWRGGWLRLSSAKLGTKYVKAAMGASYHVRRLADMASLAACFEMSRRRDDLTWSHHAVVEVLDPDEQDRSFETSAAERPSVAELRIQLHIVERRCGRGSASVLGLQRRAYRASSVRSVATKPHRGELARSVGHVG